MRLAEIKARRLNGNGIIHGAASEGREEKKKRKNFSSEKMVARGQAGNDASPAGAAAAAPPSRDPGLFRRCRDRFYFGPDASVIASRSLSIGLYLLEPPPFPSLPFPSQHPRRQG